MFSWSLVISASLVFDGINFNFLWMIISTPLSFTAASVLCKLKIKKQTDLFSKGLDEIDWKNEIKQGTMELFIRNLWRQS